MILTAGSSQANPFACIASGIAALWGPAHGGANEAVLRMLEDIGNRDNIPEALKRAKDKNDTFRSLLYHAVVLGSAIYYARCIWCNACNSAAYWYSVLLSSGCCEGLLRLLLHSCGHAAGCCHNVKSQAGFRLMGFGHRVYKTYDPRAKIMKKVCDQVLEHVGIK